eukprot:NODE_16576_length_987_cov_4.438372.p1 GENE.NODE_16576_length_987_cov_4.438372~~NODE_16576_length_987_cov_4.438372.p1  ORF type:complete len:307 (+),score=84.57 NODE_16576_length_987_cov_4.438372:116-922(+)
MAAKPPTIDYESKKGVDEYIQFHFAPPDRAMLYSFLPTAALEFPARLAAICTKHARPDRLGVAYDVGCAVGRSTFELTRNFNRAVGVDFSAAFIAAARAMQEKGELEYESWEQGVLYSKQVARLPADVIASRAEFNVGDACNLGEIGEVDCILAANLLCRLPEPRRFLDKATASLREGGLLVLVSPYSWLEEHTAPEHWLGGKPDATGAPVFSHAAIAEALDPYFEAVARSDEPFLMRNHSRTFLLGVSDCTVWRRCGGGVKRGREES